jgi:hypothetical protein
MSTMPPNTINELIKHLQQEIIDLQMQSVALNQQLKFLQKYKTPTCSKPAQATLEFPQPIESIPYAEDPYLQDQEELQIETLKTSKNFGSHFGVKKHLEFKEKIYEALNASSVPLTVMEIKDYLDKNNYVFPYTSMGSAIRNTIERFMHDVQKIPSNKRRVAFKLK